MTFNPFGQVGVPGTMGLAVPTSMDMARDTLNFVHDLRRDFEQRDTMCRLIEDVIYLNQAVQIPDNYKNTAIEVRSPLPTHIANSITAALSINRPTVHFDPIEFGDPGEDAAAYRERFFSSSWERQQREKRRRTFRAFMHSVVTKGMGILKTYERKNRVWAKYHDYRKTMLDDLDKKVDLGELDSNSKSKLFDVGTEQYKRGLPYPIETTDIQPETFYYQQGEDGFTRVAEVKEVPYYDTLMRYGASLDGKGRVVYDSVTGISQPSQEWHRMWSNGQRRTITHAEVWDWEYCTIVLRGPGDFPSSGSGQVGTGCMVRRYRHSYGNPHLKTLKGPYFSASGILTSSREPHRQNLSVLFAYLHLFPLLNSLLTMQAQAAFTFSYPAYRRTTSNNFNIPDLPFGADAVDLYSQREKIVPGGIFPHDIAPMDQPRSGIDLDKAISIVRSLIDLALPDSVQGNITGETAGYALNQAAHLASLQWNPIKDNSEDALSMRTSWESELIESHVGETVYVWGSIPQPRRSKGSPRAYKDGWMGLGPKDLKGNHNYRVVLDPASVNNDTLALRNLRDELDMRLITPDEAIRLRGRNPVEVRRGWLYHELMQDEEIRKALKQRIFQQLSTIEQESMRQLPPGGEPGAQPPVDMSQNPAGAQPGISQGLPTTGFVQPAGAVAAAPPPQLPQPSGPAPGAGMSPPMQLPRQSGTPTGAPGGVRGVPGNAVPIPGGG